MNIGIDIDDTIANTAQQIDIWANVFFEKYLKREFKIHNETGILDPKWAKYLYNLTEEEDEKFWNIYYEKIMENVEPKENVIEVINELSEKNNIIIISARWDRENGIIKKITKEWLKKYKIHYDKLFLGCEDKRKIAKESNIDIFIDDSYKTCKQISELNIETLIMNTRLNKNFEDENIKRVYSWTEILEYVNKKIYSKV